LNKIKHQDKATRNTKKLKHWDKHGIITKTEKTRKPTQKNKKEKKRQKHRNPNSQGIKTAKRNEKKT
jgi:hypothetical protein